ncbi:MAG TPA: hypothetical protein VLH60_05715 [Sedimentisphaerales bacterium]|nr:hypothetical protein [Sedimentisphaerales bacterium]
MKIKASGTFGSARRQPGVILILTLLVLIVLATATYQLTVKLADRRRTDDYLIYYQGARYACDSAIKYALVAIQTMDFAYAERADAPDFSDIFRMTDDQIDEELRAWAERLNEPNVAEGENAESEGEQDIMSMLAELFADSDEDFLSSLAAVFAPVDANDLSIPGPYGPEWPLVTEPIEFEIGQATVTITIEDENAKLPLIWLTSADPQLRPVTREILRIFSGWYGLDENTANQFQEKLDEAAEIRAFTAAITPQPHVQTVQAAPAPPATPAARAAAARAPRPPVAPLRSPARTHSDYAKIMAGSIVDAEWLTQPIIEGRDRLEYPMKYLGVWGSTQVNINTAPRHVLEAAFAFGGDADKLADYVIMQRREKPFESFDDLRTRNLAYSAQLQRSERYITTQSNFFTIRITAANGPVKCTATVAIIKQGGNITKIAAVSE